jgi:hypothetical protein
MERIARREQATAKPLRSEAARPRINWLIGEFAEVLIDGHVKFIIPYHKQYSFF